jgi:hypothetical protein
MLPVTVSLMLELSRSAAVRRWYESRQACEG